jgi:DNA polymerase
LHFKLPSGRKLSYPQPRIIGDEHEQHVVFADNAAGQFQDCRHGHGAYGGLWTENVISGIARDLLAEAMLRIEAAAIQSFYTFTTKLLPRCEKALAARTSSSIS